MRAWKGAAFNQGSVEWAPWGDQGFESRADEQDRLRVGYAFDIRVDSRFETHDSFLTA